MLLWKYSADAVQVMRRMNKLKRNALRFTILILLTAIVGCSAVAGKDSLSNRDVDEYNKSTEISCTSCHDSGKAPDPLETGGSGSDGKHDKHVTDREYNCSKCHSDYVENAYHMDGNLDKDNTVVDLVIFDSTNPDGTWTDATGSCAATTCHGTDTVEWYGADGGWTIPADCAVCHSSATSSRRQVMGPGGDFDEESHHVIDYGDRNNEIVIYNDCLVCHDQSSHMGGTVRLKEKDTAAVLAYDPANPAGLETFCLSCHDTDGALTEGNALSPFSSGNILGTMPNSAGTEIEGYWENSYTVHKDSGLTCTSCHGNTGQINAHGSESRGLLTKNVTLPIPASSPYSYTDYELCFSCHDSYPSVSKEVVLGYKESGNYDLFWAPTPYYTTGIQSLFRDVFIPGDSRSYSDTIWWDPFTPLHNYHLLSSDGMMQNVWAYRGDSGQTGKASCTTCHNVHGTGGTVRSTYDEFGITAYMSAPDEYKKMVPDSNYNDAVMKAYPINCATSCHGIVPGTNYWHTPSGE